MKDSSSQLQQSNSTRRGFLKSVGTTGAALAGALGLQHSFANPDSPVLADSGSCNYSQLPLGFIYLNSGTEGSMPDCVIRNFQEGLQKWASNPTTSYETDPIFGKHQELNRQRVGRFFGVGKDHICLTDNTTMGMSMTLMGLNFQAGDRAIMTNHEHNAIKAPLAVQEAKQGLKVITRFFPPAAELVNMSAKQLIDTLFPDIAELRGAKALCVSHVYPTTGVRLPLQALRRKADQLGISYLVVDGAQAMGMIDLGQASDHLEHCDFYAGPGHKWLNGPPGTGVLYLRKSNIRPPEFYPTLSQRMNKYLSIDSSYPMVRALQVRGCSNIPGFTAMIQAMDYQQKTGGPAHTEKHILTLAAEVKAYIHSRAPGALVSPTTDPALRSGLSVFFPFNWNKPDQLFTDQQRAEAVVAQLLEKNIQIRAIGFDNSGGQGKTTQHSYALRVSTSVFNNTQQIALFQKALKEVLLKIS